MSWLDRFWENSLSAAIDVAAYLQFLTPAPPRAPVAGKIRVYFDGTYLRQIDSGAKITEYMPVLASGRVTLTTGTAAPGRCFNVTKAGVTYDSAGSFSVPFTVAIGDALYNVSTSVGNTGGTNYASVTWSNISTSSITFSVIDETGSPTDDVDVCFTITRGGA